MKKKNSFFQFFSFFSKYTILGILLILCSIIIEQQWVENIYIEIVTNFLSTIGIALMVGAVFDFSKNSQAFTNFISNILKDIVINRTFFNDLDDTSKKQALEMILKPSEYQIEQYSDLNDYFQKKIRESMGMFHTNFKTNVVVTSDVKRVNDRIVIYSTWTYRIYKVENEYKPIITIFEKENSSIISTKILFPGGYEEVKDDEMSRMDIAEGQQVCYEYRIPERLYQYPYLTIKKNIVEKGYNHWTNVNWWTLTPCDGINFFLKCYDNISIKEYFIFDDNDLYDVEIDENMNSISIVSSSWLDKLDGFTITVSDEK